MLLALTVQAQAQVSQPQIWQHLWQALQPREECTVPSSSWARVTSSYVKR